MFIILKTQINNRLNIVILKKFRVLQKNYFSSQIYLKGIFYIARGFLC